MSPTFQLDPLDELVAVTPLRLLRSPVPEFAAIHPMGTGNRVSQAPVFPKTAVSPVAPAVSINCRLIVTDGKDVTRRPVSWLWPGRIALGKLTLIIGDPGTGKSYLTHDLVAKVTTGNAWPDSSGKAPLTHVIIVNAEDDPEDTLCPRLDILG